MGEDIKKIIINLLEIKLACDIEMINMGDWDMNDYIKHAKPYENAIAILKEGNIKDVDTKILNEAVDVLQNFIKVKDHL